LSELIIDGLLLAIWLLLPGIVFAEILRFFTKIRFLFIQSILIGVIAWLFIFLSGAILFGFFSSILWYFSFIYPIGLALAGLSIICIVVRIRKEIKPVVCNLLNIPFYSALIILIVLGIVFLFYHHIWSEFDAVSLYLVQAKGVLSTGSIVYNPYNYSTLMMISSSGLYITYAFSLFLNSSIELLRVTSAMFFILSAIALFLLSSEIFKQRIACLLTVIIYLSTVAILKTVAQFSLYTDLAFVFLLISSLFFITKWIKEKRSFWLLVTGITLTVMLFFKPFGYFIVPALIGVLLLFSKFKWGKFVGIFIAFLPLHLETFIYILKPWVTMNFSSTYYSDATNLLAKWGPCAIMSIILLLLINKKDFPGILNKKGLILFILPFVSFGIYLGYYYLNFHLLLLPDQLLNPQMNQYLPVYYQITSASSINYFTYYDWSSLLYGGLAGAYIVPLFIAIFIGIKNLRCTVDRISPYIPLIFVFTILIALWSYSGVSNSPRRLLLFSPLFAIAIVEGVLIIIRTLKISLTIGLLSFCAFALSSLGYFWIRCESITQINLRTFGLSNFEPIDYYVLGSLFIFTILMPKVLDYALSRKIHFAQKSLRKKVFNTTVIILVFALISQAIVVQGIVSYSSSVGDFNDDFNSAQGIANYYQTIGWDKTYLLGGFTDVISYFNSINNSYGVLGFYIHYLPLFTNRTVVDLTWSYGYEKFGNILTQNKSESLNIFYNNGIHYILLPMSNYPSENVYNSYLKCKEICPFLNDTSTPLEDVMNHEEYGLIHLADFECYELYEIKPISSKGIINPIVFNNNNYVVVSQSSGLDGLQDITIQTWVYLNDLPSDQGLNFEICGKQWNNLRFFVSSETDKLTVVQSFNGTAGTLTSNVPLSPQTWYNMAFSRNGSTIKIYVDGLLSVQKAFLGIAEVNDSPLVVHSFQNNTTNAAKGKMAAFLIYDRVLTEKELIWNINNVFDPSSNLRVWYKLTDNSTENILYDYSGYNYTGIIKGAR
jgi:hypothetical protein